MRIDLEATLPDETPVTLAFAETLDCGEDDARPARVVGEIRLSRAGERFHAHGEVEGRVTRVCARCLRPFEAQVRVAFDEGYRPGAPQDVPRRRALTDGDFLVPLEGTSLDVSEVVRQHVVLALPMVPVCREGCLGLCPHCGADRNLSPCACREEGIDPRLAALEALRRARG